MDNEKKQALGGVATDVPQNVDQDDSGNLNNSSVYSGLDERETRFLDALDEALEKRNGKRVRTVVAPEPKVQKIAKGIAKKGVGFISLGLILIFLGIVMICCLFSKSPNYLLPLKLSPVCAILIGVEILCNYLMTRGRFKINYVSIVISVLLVAGCCAVTISIGNSANKRREDYTNRSIAAEIYDISYDELRYVADIEELTVEVDMNPDATRVIKGPESLSTEDRVDIKVRFAGVIQTPREFAANCKKIIDGYRFMGISVTNFYFENESQLHSYKLNVEGKYAQDYSESRLTEKVSHIYLDDMNYFEDLKDYVDESSED